MSFRIVLLALCIVSITVALNANVIGGEARIIGPRPELPRDSITGTLLTAHALPSITRGAVQLYPVILAPEWRARTHLMPLHEAFRLGLLEVREADRMDQYRLYIRNYGQVPVYGQGGDFFQGGWQDRFSRKDFIVPPHGAWVPLDVYCAERGRSRGLSPLLDPRPMLGTPRLRGMVIGGEQQEVWDEIGRLRSAAPDVSDDSTSYAGVAESRALREQVEAQGLGMARDAMPRDAAGVVCIVNGRVLGLDVYGDPDLFAAMWPAVLDAYLAEAARFRPGRPDRESVADAEEALRRTAQASRRRVPSIGLGETWQIDGRGAAVGGALTLEARLVHVAMVSTMPDTYFVPEPFPR